jgi:cytochrome c
VKETVLALVVCLAASGLAHAQNYSGATASAKAKPESGEALLKRSGCGGCHALQTNLAAPALRAISAKYQGNPDAAAIIMATVKNGRHGREVLTMPAHSNVSDADARKIADHILSLTKR